MSGTYGFVTSYLNIPLHARYRFQLGSSQFSLSPYTGVEFGIGSGCNWKMDDEFSFDRECADSLGTPGGDLESLAISIPAGLSFRIHHEGGSQFAILDVKYLFGLTNTLTAAADANQKALNGVLIVQFGFTVALY